MLGSFKHRLAVYFLCLSLLPLAVIAVGYDQLARRSETRRVDARLQEGLRASLTAYYDELGRAEAGAAALAANPPFRKALARRDRATLVKALRDSPDVAVVAPGGFRLGRAPALSAERRVSVYDELGYLGEVRAYLPLDGGLLELLRLRSGLDSGERIVLVRRGRLMGSLSGSARMGRPGRPSTLELAGRRYRALAGSPLDDPPGLVLAVLSPQSAIAATVRAHDERLLLGLLAALVMIGSVAYLVGRSIVCSLQGLLSAANGFARGRLAARVEVRGRDEFAELGRAFNAMAAQLEARLDELGAERRRLREVMSRFGRALSATHDPDRLLRVVVEAAVEATGAQAGLIVGRRGELVQTGRVDERCADRLDLPLTAGGQDYGTLVLAGLGFGPEERETAASLCAHAVIALENARLHRTVERQALVDALTGLANRRHAGAVLASEIARAGRSHEPLALVLADLDDFKAVNDCHGHPFGDSVLRAFAGTLREAVREIDLAGRWGGEEFALVLPATDLAGGVLVAERVRSLWAERELVDPDGRPLTLTASFGVAVLATADDEQELVAAADAALYAAKAGGKNRVATVATTAGRP